MADEYFINVSSTYWTQGLIDGREAVKAWDAEGPQPPFTPVLSSRTAVNRRIKMYLAEELFIKRPALNKTSFMGFMSKVKCKRLQSKIESTVRT